jgi:hypothetical protein
MKTHFISLFASENLPRTLTLLFCAIALVVTSQVVGIEDNLPGFVLLIGGVICFYVSFVHIWQKPKSYAMLVLAGIGISMLLFLYQVLMDSINKPQYFINEGIGLFTVFLISLPCIIVGLIGFILLSTQGK